MIFFRTNEMLTKEARENENEKDLTKKMSLGDISLVRWKINCFEVMSLSISIFLLRFLLESIHRRPGALFINAFSGSILLVANAKIGAAIFFPPSLFLKKC